MGDGDFDIYEYSVSDDWYHFNYVINRLYLYVCLAVY